jgi:O-antigen/teichoic acid export membrane protein
MTQTSDRYSSLTKKFSHLWQDEYSKDFMKDSSWLFGRNVITALIALFQGIVIARWLKVENYGLLALIFTYVEIVNQIIDFRVYEAATKYISEFLVTERKGECLASIKLFFIIDIISGITAFIVVYLTAYLSAKYIVHRPDIAGLIAIYALSLLFNTARGTSSAILGIFNKFNWISVHTVSVAIVRLVMIILLILVLKPDVGSVVIAYVITDFFGGFSLVFLSLIPVKEKLWGFKDHSSVGLLRHRYKELRSFLLNTNANELLTLITKNIDILFLGYFRTPLEVGYYRLAKTLVGTLSLISEPFYTIIYPALTKMWIKREFEKIRDTMKKVTFFLGTALVFVSITIAVLAPFIIRLIVGAEYLPAVIAVRIMIWGHVIAGAFVWVRPLLLAAGKPNIPTLANLVCAFITVTFSVLFVPAYGHIGSAIVFLLPWLVGHMIIIGYIFKNDLLRGSVLKSL